MSDGTHLQLWGNESQCILVVFEEVALGAEAVHEQTIKIRRSVIRRDGLEVGFRAEGRTEAEYVQATDIRP